MKFSKYKCYQILVILLISLLSSVKNTNTEVKTNAQAKTVMKSQSQAKLASTMMTTTASTATSKATTIVKAQSQSQMKSTTSTGSTAKTELGSQAKSKLALKSKVKRSESMMEYFNSFFGDKNPKRKGESFYSSGNHFRFSQKNKHRGQYASHSFLGKYSYFILLLS